MPRPIRQIHRRLPMLRVPAATVLIAFVGGALPAAAQVQVSVANSYFVPLAGTSPLVTGDDAIRFLRVCPNNDPGSSLPNRVRIKIVLRDATSPTPLGIQGLTPYIKVNGGTAAQGFTGSAADSIIANNVYNQTPACTNLDRMDATAPNYRYIDADGPTDMNGETYLTFTGANGVRDPDRRWGHYDCELPVFVFDGTNEVQILGKKLESDPSTLEVDPCCPGLNLQSYGFVLRIKNFDSVGGLGTMMNQGEAVTSSDFNAIANNIGIDNLLSFWRDFDWSGSVTAVDFNMISSHLTHNCVNPIP